LAAASSAQDDKVFRTIVHEIVDSNLPTAEKALGRVVDDVTTVTGAGFETTANVLRLVFYHVFSNASILQRLRAELASAGGLPKSSPQMKVELRTLEQLPYLTSILMEGMRLSPAIASRMTRIAPDRDIVYGEWNIPAGTPVGMMTLLMHTGETLYPEPMRFEPERWMDLDARKKADKTYVPFSKGTRNCLGMQKVSACSFAWQ
jgi:cytochrome P450